MKYYGAVAGCVLAAAAFLVPTAGPATADAMADKSRSTTTDDGWVLRVTKTAETFDRVPNLAATPFTHEGFVSLKAVADITGKGKNPVNAASVTYGYQIGCQVDVSNGLTMGLSAAIGPNVGITVLPAPGVSIGGSALALPSLSFTPKPGTITTIPFGTKDLEGPHGSVTAEQVQIKVDACAGPVSLRSYAIASMSTSTADNSVAVYGDPIWW
ncbi:MspA family porin [Nocardia paucivorans]|uniref:MspA family porin n=1 Tax=Nocardia paucivorans TaxID=114259 RepID=UPI00031DDB9D|nr:MspA family porin [Nocardia paucivorans]